jgi:UDPglucose 6-dehydrogenase
VVGLLGLAFKPNTDDLREAPSLVLASGLQAQGASVQAYDPAAMKRAKLVASKISYRRDAYGAARGADAVVLVTEWNEFRQLDLDRLRQGMRRAIFVDGRNVYDPATMRAHGFEYRGIGRD